MSDDLSNVVSMQETIKQKQIKSIDRMLYAALFAAEESQINSRVASFFSKLAQNQEPLGRECEKVLYDNLWSLYGSDEL